jgi:hypothetical protein
MRAPLADLSKLIETHAVAAVLVDAEGAIQRLRRRSGRVRPTPDRGVKDFRTAGTAALRINLVRA